VNPVPSHEVGHSFRQRSQDTVESASPVPRETVVGSRGVLRILVIVMVSSMCVLTSHVDSAAATTSCAEPEAPCVVEATLTKSALRLLLASNTKSIRASWLSPSGKIVTKPLRVSKGTALLTIGGFRAAAPFALGLQACRTTKPTSCGQVSSWALQVDAQGAQEAQGAQRSVTQTLLGVGAFWLQPDPAGPQTAPVTASNPPITVPVPPAAPGATTLTATTISPTLSPATAVSTTTTLAQATTATRPPTTIAVKGSCRDGFVLRLATPTDAVCVTPAAAAQARSDNRAAATRRETTNDVDSCKPGFVHRAANSSDRVCVRPESAAQAAIDSDPKLYLSRTILPQGLDTCIAGFVFRNVFGLADDHVCVTPAERAQIIKETRGTKLGGQGVECSGTLRGAVPDDKVCVPQERRDQVLSDNAAKESRKLYNNLGSRWYLECVPPFVERRANGIDRVCVIPLVAEETAVENQHANTNKLLEFGPDTCVIGFVWRDATPGDHVCVIRAVKDATTKENATAKQRVN
jgi:hypothetical protein